MNRRRAIRHGLTLAGLLVAAFYGMQIVAAARPIDAHCYWVAQLSNLYADPAHYRYSPAFAQAIAPITWLPYPAFLAIWTGLLVGSFAWLAGPLGPLLIFAAPVASEIHSGNIQLLMTLAIVLSFRYPAAWAFVFLTKVTPGIGVLWFAFRREWRQMAIAIGGTALVVAVSFVLAPGLWVAWVETLAGLFFHPIDQPDLAIPFLVRAPVGLVLLWWGARGGHRWVVPVTAMLTLPMMWYASLSMLIGIVPLGGPGLVAWIRERVGSRRADPEPAAAAAL